MGGNNEFFENFERNKYLKKLHSMQRVKQPPKGSPNKIWLLKAGCSLMQDKDIG